MKDEKAAAAGRINLSRRLFIGSAAGGTALALAPRAARSELVKSAPSAEVGSIEAVRGLVARNFPGREGSFEFSLVPRPACGHDHYEVSSLGDRIAVSGTSALALASGLHWYLKYMLRRHWSWCGKNWDLPDELPKIINPVRKESPYLHNGYFNYCTYNYTMSWWGWERWERELDYMALNNVTLPLAITGVENVWLNFLLRLGYTRDEAKKYICGPAYFAWWLMGNLEGFGGPLPDSWLDSHLELGQKIIARMREFGMTPMLQGFVGLVPTSLKARKPNAHIIPQGFWCEDYLRPDVLNPTDPLFPELAKIWYEELEKLFGKTRYFAGDLFHEGGKTGGANIADAAKAVYREMDKASPDAVWVLQGWGGNPKPEMLRGLERGQALIIDLMCERPPALPSRNGWGGHPWLWNTIFNFGGNPGIFGDLHVVAKEPVMMLDHRWISKNIQGLGTTPEAIEHNPVQWDLHFEMFWRRHSPDLSAWVKDYALRRYGAINADAEAAWAVLLDTAYNVKGRGCQTSMINYRPNNISLRMKPPTWAYDVPNYNHAQFPSAVRAMHAAAKELAGRDAFDYDLVDVTRQFLSNLFFRFFERLRSAFLKKDVAGYKTWAKRIRDLLLDLDALLSTRREFMMGAWIADARGWGQTDAEKDLYEFNARNLVTCWTYKKGQLNDYSRREWSGLIKDYYLARWQAFMDYHLALLEGREAKAPDYYNDIEKGYADRREVYPSEPTGPAAPKAKEMYEKYWALMEAEGLYR